MTPVYSFCRVLVVLFSVRVTGMAFRERKRYRAVVSEAESVLCRRVSLKVATQPLVVRFGRAEVAASAAMNDCRPAAAC